MKATKLYQILLYTTFIQLSPALTYGMECLPIYKLIYEVDSPYLKVKVTFNGRKDNLHADIENFKLSYEPPKSFMHPMRILLGKDPIVLNTPDVMPEARLTSSGIGKGYLEIYLNGNTNITMGPNGKPLGELHFDRLGLFADSGKFEFLYPTDNFYRNAGQYLMSGINQSLGKDSIQGTWTKIEPSGNRIIGAPLPPMPEENLQPGALVPSVRMKKTSGYEFEALPVRSAEPEKPAKLFNSGSKEDNRFQEQLAQKLSKEAKLPAFQTNVENIFYDYNKDGLKINVTINTPSRAGHFDGNSMKSVSIEYDPKHYGLFSKIRQVFGNKPLKLTTEDIKLFHSFSMAGAEGDYLEIALKDGQRIMLSQYTGKVIFFRKQGDKMLGIINDLAEELEFYKKPREWNTGTWSTSDNMIQGVQRAQRLPR
jgi:hypothetical protein